MRVKLAIFPELKNSGGDPNKKWEIHYSVRNPKTGKMERFRISKGMGAKVPLDKKLKISEILLKEYTDKLKSGWTPWNNEGKNVIYEDELRYRHVSQIYKNARASNNTVRYCASEYLKFINFSKSDATISTYRSKLRIFCDWLNYKNLGDNDVTTISNDIIIEFFWFLIKERKLSGNSVRKYKNTLHLFFEYICNHKKTKINPVYNTPTSNLVNDQSPIPIYDEDIIKLKNDIMYNDPQLWLAIQFQFYCALRPGKELRLMKISDIDFNYGYVYVNRSRAKNNKKRGIKIPDVFLNILISEYKLHLEPKMYFVFGKNYRPGSSCLGKNNMRYRFNRFRDKFSMCKEYKFYSWKHTGAMKLLRENFTIEDISKHLGHGSVSSTMHYIKNKFGWEPERISKEYPSL